MTEVLAVLVFIAVLGVALLGVVNKSREARSRAWANWQRHYPGIPPPYFFRAKWGQEPPDEP